MTFNGLLDKEVPKITLADFIRLCLAVDDDKVLYISVELCGRFNRYNEPIEPKKDIRITDPVLQPYYEYQIVGIYTTETINLILKEGENEHV